MTERRIDVTNGWPTPSKGSPLGSISSTQKPGYTASTYFARLARMIHKYGHGAPFFSVALDETSTGSWYEFKAGPGAGTFGFVMPVTLNQVEVSRVDEFMGHLQEIETTYDKFIDLKYIKNIAHKLTTDERKRVQKWIADGNSIENI